MTEVRTPAWSTVDTRNKNPPNATCCIGLSRNMYSWNLLVKTLSDMLELFLQNCDV